MYLAPNGVCEVLDGGALFVSYVDFEEPKSRIACGCEGFFILDTDLLSIAAETCNDSLMREKRMKISNVVLKQSNTVAPFVYVEKKTV